MIKLEALENFYLKDFNKLGKIERKSKEERGQLFAGDVFECEQSMCDYLLGENPLKRAVAKVIEVKPEIKEVPIEKEPIKLVEKPKKSRIKKK